MSLKAEQWLYAPLSHELRISAWSSGLPLRKSALNFNLQLPPTIANVLKLGSHPLTQVSIDQTYSAFFFRELFLGLGFFVIEVLELLADVSKLDAQVCVLFVDVFRVSLSIHSVSP